MHRPSAGRAVVTLHGFPCMAEWPRYADAYWRLLTDALAARQRFALVFDLRAVRWDGDAILDFARLKCHLTAQLKPVTARVVVGVVILTASADLATLVTTLARAGGQTSPMYCLADTARAEATIDALEAIVCAPVATRPAHLTLTQCLVGVLVLLLQQLPHLLAPLPRAYVPAT